MKSNANAMNQGSAVVVDDFNPNVVVCEYSIRGITQLIFGKSIDSVKPPKVDHEVFDREHATERAHVKPNGTLFIPARAIHMALVSTCKYTGETVKGMGKKTYTKLFQAGIMTSDITLDCGDGCQITGVMVDTGGKAGGGSGTRVKRYFPMVQEWTGTGTIEILDEFLADNVGKVKEYLARAGYFNGLGTWRPQTGGMNGRFVVERFEIVEKIKNQR